MSAPTAVDPSTRVYRTVNPATGELVREFDTFTDEQAEAALAKAHGAFPLYCCAALRTWSRRTSTSSPG
jgi:acyl-CoA reductase-like NAD-dependent aldehyde dehydrogenase